MMKISIVTLSYNQSKYLRRCILSIINQGYDDLEYIVVDPGSTDGSRDIINSFGAKISKKIFEPDGGPAEGLNKGFSIATGEYCIFINADDVLLPGAIESMLRHCSVNNGVDVVYGNGYQIDEFGHVVRRLRSHTFNPYLLSHGVTMLMQPSIFLSREIFQRTNGFNNLNKTCWDTELWIDLHLAGARFLKTNEYWSAFSYYKGSISSEISKDSGASGDAYVKDLERLRRKLGVDITSTFGKLRSKSVKYERIVREPSYYISRFFDESKTACDVGVNIRQAMTESMNDKTSARK